MKILLLLLLFSAPAFAQEALKPIHYSMETESRADDPNEQEFHRLFMEEMRKIRGAVATSYFVDHAIYLAVAPIKQHGERVGYAASVFVVSARPKRFHYEIQTGTTLLQLARDFVEDLQKNVFAPRREVED